MNQGIKGATVKPWMKGPAMTAPLAPPRPSGCPAGDSAQTLLIVDASPGDRPLAETVVNQRAGWHILHAGSGVEALARLRAGGVQVVLADLLMPRMDGLELVEAVREQFPG